MYKQQNQDATTLLNNILGESRLAAPFLCGTIRRANPDGTNPQPHFTGLSGTSLTIEQGGTFTSTTVISFTSDNYSDALITAQLAGATNFTVADSGGYITFTSGYSGDQNFMRILSGTAASILGLPVHPHPSATSYAGQLKNPLPTFYESSRGNEVGTIRGETVTRETINRAISAVSAANNYLLANLNKEIVVPQEVSVTISGTSFSLAPTDKFYIGASSTANTSADSIENMVTVLNSDNTQVFDATGARVRVSSITYGTLVDATSSFSAWGTPDGKSVFGGSSHWQKTKSSATITSIVGNIVYCSAGTFVTDKVLPGDTFRLTGATNVTPYNPNGEYLVDEVIADTLLRIRPKGVSDTLLFTSNTPSGLNSKKDSGEVYGTATIPLGKAIPTGMKGADMLFNLTASLSGTYKIVFSCARQLSSLAKEDLSKAVVPHEYGGQIELGSKLYTTLVNALKPRIISKPNNDTTKTLLSEFKNGTVGCRIYILKAGGLEIVYNGKWDGTTYVKDDAGQDVVIMKEDGVDILIGTTDFSLSIDYINKIAVLGGSTSKLSINQTSGVSTLGGSAFGLSINQTSTIASLGSTSNNINVDHSTGVVKAKITNDLVVNDGTNDVIDIPNFDGTNTSQVILKAGVNLGIGYTSDTQALINKISYTCTTTTDKYTLLTETVLSGARKREYVLADGSSLITINARWTGTTWNKDITSIPNNRSTKILISELTSDLQIYTEESTSPTFTDTSWTNIKIPYSLIDTQNAVLNNKIPIFLEEFTGVNSDKYLFSTTLSDATKCSFGSSATSDSDCFGAGKFILTNTDTTWTLDGAAASLYIGSLDFIMRYRFKIKRKALLRSIGSFSFVGTNPSSISDSMGVVFASDLTNFRYKLENSTADTGVVISDDAWTIVEWQRIGTKLYLVIDQNGSKTTVLNGVTDLSSRTITPSYLIKADNTVGPSFPADVFLIDYFESYKK